MEVITMESAAFKKLTIPRADEERMGAPGVEILVLAVTKPGTYNIRMDYKRSWEKMSLQSFNFIVIAE